MFFKALTEIMGIEATRANRISRIFSVTAKLALLIFTCVFIINLTSMAFGEIGRGQRLTEKDRKQKAVLTQKRIDILEMRRVKCIEQMPDFEDAILKANGKELSSGEKRLAYTDETRVTNAND